MSAIFINVLDVRATIGTDTSGLAVGATGFVIKSAIPMTNKILSRTLKAMATSLSLLGSSIKV